MSADLGSIVGVWPHPDDESYVAAGLAMRAVAAGARVVCVTATHADGLRAAELAEALSVLGITEHVALGYTDGACASVDPAEGTARIADVIRAVRPDTVLTFGPDGYTGHPDHIAVSGWTSAAVAGTGARLLHTATTAAVHREFADINDGFDVFFAGGPTLVEESEFAVRYVLDDAVLERKIRALEAHRSQTAALIEAVGRERYGRWVRIEGFVDASPGQRGAGRVVA